MDLPDFSELFRRFRWLSMLTQYGVQGISIVLFLGYPTAKSSKAFIMYTSYLNNTEYRKLICLNECPCSHQMIVPEHWLDAMVSGGLRVWHLISLLAIVAFGLLLLCCCCCEQKFRIPRTKEQIEMNSVRAKWTKRFNNQLTRLIITKQPTTFKEALKEVRELEEKLLLWPGEEVDIQGSGFRLRF